jgi:hypothetical protein
VVRAWEVSGQLGAGSVVEVELGGVEVLGEVGAGVGAGGEQDVRGEVEQPGECDLRWCRAQSCGLGGE